MTPVQPPPIVEDAAVEEIVRIGMERLPHEACGLLMPDGSVVELVNHSHEPADSFVIWGTDARDAVIAWAQTNPTTKDGRDSWEQIADALGGKTIVVWHTHPNGFEGPSQGDLGAVRGDSQIPPHSSLVVALPSGRAILY